MVMGLDDEMAMPHAWVELPGGIVFDGVLQRFYQKEGYYRALDCKVVKEYSIKEAMRLTSVWGHFGPWPFYGNWSSHQ